MSSCSDWFFANCLCYSNHSVTKINNHCIYNNYSLLTAITLGMSLFCFFPPIFLSSNSFLITYYAQYFAQNLPILLSINKILLELKNTCD